MRAGIYLRVSTEDQVEKFGLDAQRARCEAMASAKGWDIVGTFADEGVSGTLGPMDRPGLAAVLDAATDGEIDAVIVAALDRLGRKTSVILNVTTLLENLGIEFLSCRESLDTSTPAGQFAFTMFAALAQLDRDNTVERLMDGVVASVKDGNVHIGGSNAPYGYNVAEVDGKRTLIVNEKEAEIVRQMFTHVAKGNTIHSLTDWLTERGVPKPAKGQNHKRATKRHRWSIGSISGILSNEVYVGRWYYGKTQLVELPDGTKKRVKTPKKDWLLVEVPAIIDEPLFELVKDRRKQNKRQMAGRRSHTYALSGMLTCGHCRLIGMTGITRHEKTKTMGERTYSYYVCNRRHNRKRFGVEKCPMPPITTDELELTVAVWVFDKLLTPNKLREEWQKHREASLEEMQPIFRMIEANEKKLEELQEEKRRLIKAYREGVLSLDDLAADKTDIERLIEEHTNANEALYADVDKQVPSEIEFESLEEYVEELAIGAHEGLEDLELQHDVYRKLNLKATVTFEDEQHWVDISCHLGKVRLSTASPIEPYSSFGWEVRARLQVGDELTKILFVGIRSLAADHRN